MSIATMVRLGAARQTASSQPSGSVVSGGSGQPTPTVQSAMEKVATFIPSEVIGLYVAGFGILSPEAESSKWWIFGICFALIPIIMLLNYAIQKKRSVQTPKLWISLVLFVFAAVAFVAWAAALPDTPFLTFSPQATEYGGYTVMILAVVMYKAAEVLGVVPR